MESFINVLAIIVGMVVGNCLGLAWYYDYRKGQGMYQKPKARRAGRHVETHS